MAGLRPSSLERCGIACAKRVDVAVSLGVSQSMRAVSGPRPRIPATVALMFAVGLGAGCDSSDVTLQGRTSLTISPLQARLPVGDTIRIRAVSNGRPCDCLWTSWDLARATVDATGLVRALTPGVVQVVATVRRDQNAKAALLVEVIAP